MNIAYLRTVNIVASYENIIILKWFNRLTNIQLYTDWCFTIQIADSSAKYGARKILRFERRDSKEEILRLYDELVSS